MINSLSIAALVDEELRERWYQTIKRLHDFLSKAELPETGTQAILLFGKKTNNPDRSVEQLMLQVADEGEWAYLTGRYEPADSHTLIALPAKGLTPSNGHQTPFIETHSRLTAWWLINTWRSRKLAENTWQLGNNGHVVAAAACARALLETAAAIWYDALKLGELWDSIKKAGNAADLAINNWQRMAVWLWHAQYGAKFDDRVPELKKMWEHLPRTNVLTQVQKLAKATSITLQSDYQWLCNAVHPSIGGTFSFSSPIMMHDTNTYARVFHDSIPLVLDEPSGTQAEKTIQAALIRASIISVETIVKTQVEVLKIIDDIALTTGAPDMADFEYWRNIKVTHRNQECPCGSGLKAKRCSHVWGKSGPKITKEFDFGL